MMSRKSLVIATFTAMAVGYILLPIHVGLSVMQTDVVFSILLTLALCILVYEDHRTSKQPKHLWAAIVSFCSLIFVVTVSTLISGLPFAMLIPFVALCGGILYWYIDRYVPPVME